MFEWLEAHEVAVAQEAIEKWRHRQSSPKEQGEREKCFFDVKQYALIRKIATGGMAEVFLAQDSKKNLVVVKKILAHLASDPEYVRMFQNELDIVSRLRHPNVVRVLEIHSDWAAMEYVEGRDWRTLSSYSIPQPVALTIMIQALEVLSYIHQLKIVHRDISPQNWMLTERGEVKLLDFGISKFEDQAHNTATGVLKGKYCYMSPEQARGEKIYSQSDIFSMGVILYELCSKTRLFKRASDFLTLKAITECEVEIPPQISLELGQIILKSLAQRAEDRFKTCDEFRRALIDYGRKYNQIASGMEVISFMRRLPNLSNRVLFENTQVYVPASNAWAAGAVALLLAFFGFCW